MNNKVLVLPDKRLNSKLASVKSSDLVSVSTLAGTFNNSPVNNIYVAPSLAEWARENKDKVNHQKIRYQNRRHILKLIP